MKTRRFCSHCGRPLVKSKLSKGENHYAFQCYGCGEDFYKFEVYRKKDIEIVRTIRRNAYNSDLGDGILPIHSYKKPYPSRAY